MTVDGNKFTIGKRTFTILFPDLLRDLSSAEIAELELSIIANGVLVPLIVDEDDGVIDGGHRLRVAAQIGLKKLPTAVMEGLALEKKRELAETINYARRQLTPEDRKQRVLQMRQQGMSYRQIGDKLGVDAATAFKDLKDSTVGNPTVELPDKVQSKDGKERPAKQPKKEKDSEAEPSFGDSTVGNPTVELPDKVQKPAEELTEEPARDALGVPLETVEAGLVFGELDKFDEAKKLLAAAQKVINQIARGPAGAIYKQLLSQRASKGKDEFVFRSESVHKGQVDLDFSRPHSTLCPYCFEQGHENSETCTACQGRPYVTRLQFQRAAAEIRKPLEAHAERLQEGAAT